MHKREILSSIVILLSVAAIAPAVDRDAEMVDTISVETMQYDDGDSLGLSLWGETATAMDEKKWAVLFGGNVGTIWPDMGDGIDYWEIGLGMKYYVLQDTSLALVGLYREVDQPDDPKILTADLTLKHRFVPAYETVSPFIRGGIGARTVEYTSEPDVGVNDFSEMIFSFGLGIDFMMTDHFAFVFEGTRYITEKLDEDETPNWWIGRVGMQYYWE